jgi:hypothetical protein
MKPLTKDIVSPNNPSVKRMSEEAQRIAIGVEDGWNSKPETLISGMPWGVVGLKPSWWFPHQLPDYLHDLNAIHKVEVFDEDGLREYLENLAIVCGREPREPELATAAQRAEAFLKAIGKWNDSI